MTADEIRYMLAKQVQTMKEIETQYGVISLDDYELSNHKIKRGDGGK